MSYPNTLKRTSMSLDTATLESLALLADKWATSKSEVVRRAVRKAKEGEALKTARMTPVEALEWIRAGNGLSEEEAKYFTDEVAAERNAKVYWWEANDPSL
jgi:predicted transcriptional regulator